VLDLLDSKKKLRKFKKKIKMEFSKEICSSVVIKPDQLEHLQKNIIKNLIDQVKGKCMENTGYIKDIQKILNVSSKKLINRNGNAKFSVKYIAKVIQPKIGDIIEGKVETIMVDGILASNGPVQIYAKLLPNNNTVYEHQTYKFKILDYRLDDEQIWCVGDLNAQ
jgi:DNA-directed RNA polymerase subunit E'/Rpb7